MNLHSHVFALVALGLWAALALGACQSNAPVAATGEYTGPPPVFTSDAKSGDAQAADAGAKDAAIADQVGGEDGGEDAAEDATAADAQIGDALADVALVDGVEADAADALGDAADAKADVADAKTDAADAKTDAAADSNADSAADSGADAAPSCGDGSCGAGETCKTCAKDCGSCPAACGDGTCNPTENCQTCSQDCGNCPAFCGNGTCDADETCGACPADCPCPKCGDGKCDAATENCQKCPGDCGACPGQCSPLTSQGCPSGQQCYPQANANPVCSKPGSAALGQPCIGLADCAFGMLCISGVCGKVCDTSGTTPAYLCKSPAVCAGISVGGKPLPYNIGFCFGGDSCNLVSNVGCPSGLACTPVNDGKACVKPGSGGSGAACTSDEDCLATHLCVAESQGGPSKCFKKCLYPSGSPSCSGPQSCVAVTTGAPPKAAADGLGICN